MPHRHIVSQYIPRDPAEEQSLSSSIQVLRTRDNSTFLASCIRKVQVNDLLNQGYLTKLSTSILDTAQISISRILNHPNIISIVDIVNTSGQDENTSAMGAFGDITVWEDMTAGSLAYILPSSDNLPAFEDQAAWASHAAQNFQRFSLPESLCWHVLRSISRSLLWLHHGVKETEGIPGDWNRHDEDWQAILIMDMSPGQIWFKQPKGPETYGECKLGGFSHAKVCGSPGALSAASWRIDSLPIHKQYYWAPVRSSLLSPSPPLLFRARNVVTDG